MADRSALTLDLCTSKSRVRSGCMLLLVSERMCVCQRCSINWRKGQNVVEVFQASSLFTWQVKKTVCTWVVHHTDLKLESLYTRRRPVQSRPQACRCNLHVWIYIHCKRLVASADHLARINACGFALACIQCGYVINLVQLLHHNINVQHTLLRPAALRCDPLLLVCRCWPWQWALVCAS